jgi:hypothetical protein
MSLQMALNGTVAGDFLLAAFVLLGVKFAVTVVQIAMMRGKYKVLPKGVWFRVVYVTGKVTPSLAAVCLFVSAMLEHNRRDSWFYGCLAGFAAALAICVVRLRKKGKFFGLLDMLSPR